MGKVYENQGVWEFERGFLHRIYARKLGVWGCDMVEKRENSISVVESCFRGAIFRSE